MSLSAREKIMLFALGAILIVFVGARFVVTPLYNRFVSSTATMLEDGSAKLTAQMKVQSADKMEAATSQALSDADSAAQTLLPSLDNEMLDVWINGFVTGAGMKTTSILFGSPVSTDISTGLGDAAAASKTRQNTNDTDAVTTPEYRLKKYAEAYKSGGKTASSASSAPSAAAGTSSSSSSSSSSASSSSASSSGSTAAAGAVLGEQVMVTASGSYAQVNRFLNAVQNSGKTVRVYSFICRPSGGGCVMAAVLECYGAEKPDDSDATFKWSLPAPAGKSSLIP